MAESKGLDPNFFDRCTILKIGKGEKILTKEYGWLSFDWKEINSLPPLQRQKILDSITRMLERKKKSAVQGKPKQ